MAARAFIGAGDLYIARYDALTAAFLPFAGPYETNKFEIKPNVELLEQKSKGRTTYGQVIESVALAEPADFTVELTEINKESIAIALLGNQAVYTQASGTAASATVTMTPGLWSRLPHRGVSNVAITGSVLGTDFIVNGPMGLVKALEGGNLTGSETITYNHSALSGTRISGGVNTDVRAKFLLDGINLVDKLPCIVEVHEGIIAADAAFDFLADSFNNLPLPGRMKTPTGFSEPFRVDMLSTAWA